VPARIGSLVMVFQRSPLVKLLPEARVISTSGFTETAVRSMAVIAGLKGYDSIAGASEIIQLLPSPGLLTVHGVAGDPLSFVFQTIGTPHIPAQYQVGDLPPGMVHSDQHHSAVDSITGVPTLAGSYLVSVMAWELPGFTGASLEQTFTFEIVNPPLPQITTPPAGGSFPAGSFVRLSAAQNHGRTFTWTRDGEDVAPHEHLLCARAGTRKYRRAPVSDPGPAWRSGDPFVESTDPSSETDPAWTSISGGIGYDQETATGANFLPQIAAGGDLGGLMFGEASPPRPVAIHLRVPFNISAPHVLGYLKLRVQCDDGFVAWLNGAEVASQNKPATFAWNSAAGAEANDAVAVSFREIDISQHLPRLRPGENLLAVQAMNRSVTSPDFLFNCELSAGINGTNSPHLVLTDLQTPVAGEYRLTVSNAAGSESTEPVPVLVLPSIFSHPESVRIEHGATAQLGVTPEGSPPFSYQWFRGMSGDTAAPVPGATDEAFTTPPLTETTAFWVRVTTPAGTADSDTATVTVDPAPVSPYASWQAAVFSAEDAENPAVSGPAADPDGDGLTNEQEYILGAPPLSSQSDAGIKAIESGIEITFTAQRAAGPGYAGRIRHYAVESTSGIPSEPWVTLPQAADITGDDQTVTLSIPRDSTRTWYRLRVWLTP
jgi:hypothetical protein